MCRIDWVAVGTFLSFGALIFSAWWIRGQIAAVREAMYSQSWSVAVNMIEDELATRITEDLYQQDRRRPRPEGTELFTDNILFRGVYLPRSEMASTLCNRYDSVAVMIEFGMLPAGIVTSARGATIAKLWQILLPHIEERRTTEQNPRKWGHFEALAARARANAG